MTAPPPPCDDGRPPEPAGSPCRGTGPPPAGAASLTPAVTEALISGGIAFVLLVFIVGHRISLSGTDLVVTTHWPLVLAGTLAVIIGRFCLRLIVDRRGRGTGTLAAALRPVASALRPVTSAFRSITGERATSMAGVGLFVIAVTFPLFAGRYGLDLGIMLLTYIMLGWGLNIVVGLAGLLDLGYVAFYAVGAYSYALLSHYFGLSFWICLPLAGILAAFWGIILGFPVLRLRGDYLAIVTLAFGEIIRIVLLNWYSFTNGPDGISGIPRPDFLGLPFSRGEDGFAAFFGLPYSPLHRIIFLYYLILALALLTNAITNRLRRLPPGRAWEAMREDDIACRSLGINLTLTKLAAFSTGAMFGGLAGAFFATRQGFVSPESFVFIESAIILAIVVLGGMGSQLGVVIATLVMIGAFEFFRELNEYRMLIFGLALVLVMVWRPRGLIARRLPSVTLREYRRADGSHALGGQ